MSVFRGSIIECPGIIVDHFTPSNCRRGRAFFLSHCHKDHMTGLDSSDLLFALKTKTTYLYCSEVTKGLLTGDHHFTKLIPLMKSLPIEEQITIKMHPVDEEKEMNVSVTLLPAGHCPGSVMFLYQWENTTVLYTGDFRLNMAELKSISCLHNNGSPIDMDTVYLDTTFCHDLASNIISREKTREYIIEIMEKWLAADTSNSVYLNCPSFGYEHIFLAVSKHFKTKIHISSWRMNSYSTATLSEVQQCLTLDGNTTRIHSCWSKRKGKMAELPCTKTSGLHQSHRVLVVKPSTQWFVTSAGRLNHPLVYFKGFNLARVLHSMHASYSELKEFVSYLSPRSVVPCVIPYSIGDTSIVDLHDRIRKLLPVSLPAATSQSCFMDDNTEEGVVRQRRDPVGVDPEGDQEESEGSDYDTDDEFICSEDWAKEWSHDHLSHDQSSHEQSSDYSFDLSLPAFPPSTDGGVSTTDKDRLQPSIELSFDSDDKQFDREGNGGSQPIKPNEPIVSVSDQSRNSTESPQPKKRRLSDGLQQHDDDSYTRDSLSSSSPLSNAVIDLTRSSTSSLSNRDHLGSNTPDSAIIYIGTSQIPTIDNTSTTNALLSSANDSIQDTTVPPFISTPSKLAPDHPPAPVSPGSPWLYPPTPGKDNEDCSVTHFGNKKSFDLFK